MSSKRLGKGIYAIINPKTKKSNSASKSATTAPGVSKVKLKDINPNPDQPRRDFDEQSLDQLSQSIKKKGVITPLTLRKQNDGYEIIAGERRWRAAKKANLRSCLLYTSPSPRDS